MIELAAALDDGPLVVDDWRRIHGKLPNAISTSDSRRPVGALDLGLLFELIPPAATKKSHFLKFQIKKKKAGKFFFFKKISPLHRAQSALDTILVCGEDY